MEPLAPDLAGQCHADFVALLRGYLALAEALVGMECHNAVCFTKTFLYGPHILPRMRNRTVGINIRVTVTEKKKVTMLARKCGLSLSEYLRQRALGYEPGGHPPKEVFEVLDKIDEKAESCSVRDGAAINAQTDRMRDLLIGGN